MVASIGPVNRTLTRVPPLAASLALVSMGLGAALLVGVGLLTLLPLALLVGMIAGWVLVSLLLGWAGIEALAALERWMERDTRFQR